MTFVIFYKQLEFVADTPLEIIAILSTIGCYYGYHKHVDVEQLFERMG
jgi:hypothetical protein